VGVDSHKVFGSCYDTETVDLNHPPSLWERTDSALFDGCYTFPDIHANSLKLAYLLRRCGFILPVSGWDQSYLAFNRSYNQYGQTEDLGTEIAVMRKQLHSLSQGLSAKAGRLIQVGDLFNDRGHNHLFIFMLIQQLLIKKVPLTIVLSNHDLWNLITRERRAQFKAYWKPQECRSFKEYQTSRKAGYVSSEEHCGFLKDYCSVLKIIDGSVSPDKKTIRLWSHAPICCDVIPFLAKTFKVFCNDSSPVALANSIDSINQAFQDALQTGEFMVLLEKENEYLQKHPESRDKSDYTKTPLYYCLWNRNLVGIQPEYKGYGLSCVHGHHEYPDETRSHFIRCVNSNWGKPGQDRGTSMVDYGRYSPRPPLKKKEDQETVFGARKSWSMAQRRSSLLVFVILVLGAMVSGLASLIGVFSVFWCVRSFLLKPAAFDYFIRHKEAQGEQALEALECGRCVNGWEKYGESFLKGISWRHYGAYLAGEKLGEQQRKRNIVL
jgi:hypothetical protein